MRTLLILLRKEYKQIFRNKMLLRMILVVPIIQLIVIPLTADYEIKNINVAIVDHDKSGWSRDLTAKIASSGYFIIVENTHDMNSAERLMEADQADIILEIPSGFERNLVREQQDQIYMAVNAINGTKANVGGGYLTQVIRDFNHQIVLDWSGRNTSQVEGIEVTATNWFNKHLNYQVFMVPGILVVLVTMVGTYMCSLNIVKEKEVGTIEQINVTPIRKHHFILGKLIPFWTIGMFEFTIGLLLVARVIYGIIPVGSIGLLYAFLTIYLIAILGIGLLISTYSNTQQQAMSLAFFLMMIFLLMSGLFTSIDSMPRWAQFIAYGNPVTYFIEAIRMIVMKGSGLNHIMRHFLVMVGFAVFFNGWAIMNYRKSSS